MARDAKDRDTELDAWLRAMDQVRPSGDQIGRWKAATRAATRRRPSPSPQMIAALVVGFLLGIGVLSLRNPPGGREPAGNFDPTATVEVIFDKSQ